jgi:predicted ATPase/DNA-binding SARP family transcriptional activator
MSEYSPLRPGNLGQAARSGGPAPTPEAHPKAGTPSGLQLRLFGPIEVRIGLASLPHLRSRKGLWLVALLALRGGRDVDRDWIAGTLWPDCDEFNSRRSLRQTLHDLRLALGTEAWRLKSDEPRTLRLELGGASVDALEFDEAIKKRDPTLLETAVQLYRGPLLEDCAEEWALEGRRQREQAVIGALETLASHATLRHEHGVAADLLRTALRLDMYREDLLRALMQALAADGNAAAALVAFREYRALLGRQLVGEPADETVSLFRRLRDDSRAMRSADTVRRSPRLQGSPASPTRRTLPTPLTALIGRDEDVRKVVFLAARARLLTLTGTGGVGKTRLAIRVAEELAADYDDGVAFVDLAPLESPELLPDVIWAALGAPQEEGLQDPAEVLCSYLSGRRILLVLDNCEQLGPACGALAEILLGRCPGLRILATSRQVLGVKGETVWRTSSLAVPKTGSNRPISAADIGHVSRFQDFAAIQLFAERAHAAESTFRITPKNSVAVVKICSRLDGIPLAIELAAARVKAMPVEKIADRLNDRFRLLLGGRRSSPKSPIPRHQTLRASIDWSYDLLSEQERALMLRLAVFAGGWTLETAEAVCPGEAVQEWELLELLTGLVEKSLVVYQPDEDRYRLLETIRQYLTDRLDEEGAANGAAARFLSYFLDFAEEADKNLTGPAQIEWLARLETEHDNLRAAMSHANAAARGLRDSEPSAGDTENGSLADSSLSMVAALTHFWWVRGYLREGRARIEQALAVGHGSATIRGRALNAAGTLAFRQADYSAASKHYHESLSLSRSSSEPLRIASLLNNLGMVAYAQEDFQSAWSLYSEALALRREHGGPSDVSASLNNLGTVVHRQRDFEAAKTLYRESLAIRRELGDSQGIAGSLNNLAGVALAERDYSGARSLHKESLPIRRDLGDSQGMAASLEALAETEWQWLDPLGVDELSTNSREEKGQGTHECVRAAIRAARLLGAADGLRKAIGAPMLPDEKAENERLIQRIQEVVDAELFAAEWGKGRMMNLEDAVSSALAESREL